MERIGNEPTMTVKEIANKLNKDESTIRKIGKELFPELFQNGIKTNLNEMHITAIKLHLGKNSELPKTQLEKKLLIQQAMNFLNEEVEELKKEIDTLKPKALNYDKFISGENYHTMNEAAKIVGFGEYKLFRLLRELSILQANNIPYQSFINRGLFVVKDTPVYINNKIYNKPQTFVTAKGIEYISQYI